MSTPDMLSARDAASSPPSLRSPEEELTLLELLDRVLDKGVVLSGEVTLSVADVDLVYLGLRVLLSSVEAAERMRRGEPAGGA
jgi:gas vesicle structural protein